MNQTQTLTYQDLVEEVVTRYGWEGIDRRDIDAIIDEMVPDETQEQIEFQDRVQNYLGLTDEQMFDARLFHGRPQDALTWVNKEEEAFQHEIADYLNMPRYQVQKIRRDWVGQLEEDSDNDF